MEEGVVNVEYIDGGDGSRLSDKTIEESAARGEPSGYGTGGGIDTSRGVGVLRACRFSVAIRRFVHSYTRTFVYLSWTGTSWKGAARQGPAIPHETGSRPTGFS